MTKQEAIAQMLAVLDSGQGILVSNDDWCPGLPTIHNVGNGQRHPLKTLDEVKHVGFGLFYARTPDISFDAGGTMHNVSDGENEWLFGWTRLRGSKEALEVLGYDTQAVKNLLESVAD